MDLLIQNQVLPQIFLYTLQKYHDILNYFFFLQLVDSNYFIRYQTSLIRLFYLYIIDKQKCSEILMTKNMYQVIKVIFLQIWKLIQDYIFIQEIHLHLQLISQRLQGKSHQTYHIHNVTQFYCYFILYSNYTNKIFQLLFQLHNIFHIQIRVMKYFSILDRIQIVCHKQMKNFHILKIFYYKSFSTQFDSNYLGIFVLFEDLFTNKHIQIKQNLLGNLLKFIGYQIID
ncbi:unnamed protein product [Paramecium pentaurelia]|uniref:Uncharacterized protein n=1 Tax=Paramecium pentaurelia TaxID=43138 RepID=A0A8S1YLG5_9CILI|nr:unnamed protein product [Paramecium pentaurelia]